VRPLGVIARHLAGDRHRLNLSRLRLRRRHRGGEP
jgi:hypothetical protein